MQTRGRLVELVSRSTLHGLAPEREELAHDVQEGQHFGFASHEPDDVDADANLELGAGTQLIEDKVRIRRPSKLHDDAHAVAIALVAHVSHALDLSRVDEIGDLLAQRRLVGLVRDARDDDGARAAALPFFPLLTFSIVAAPRRVTDPRPVRYISRYPPRGATMIPPVGKSGAGMTARRSSTAQSSGSAAYTRSASATSRRLCGGIDVAIPTAMPVLPLISMFGRRAGSTEGSVCDPSNVSVKSTASGDVREEQHRLGDGSEATLGVPHRRGDRRRGIQVSVAVDEDRGHGEVLGHAHEGVVHGLVSVGVELAEDLADDARAFLNGFLESRPSSCMPKRMRRCTGLRPSRTSGRARPTMTLIAYAR